MNHNEIILRKANIKRTKKTQWHKEEALQKGSNLQFNYNEMGNRKEINCPRNAIMPFQEMNTTRERGEKTKIADERNRNWKMKQKRRLPLLTRMPSHDYGLNSKLNGLQQKLL